MKGRLILLAYEQRRDDELPVADDRLLNSFWDCCEDCGLQRGILVDSDTTETCHIFEIRRVTGS